MTTKQIFSAEEKNLFAASLEDKFQRAGLSDLLNQKSESTNNHFDEEFFKQVAGGYHLVKDNALQGT